MQNETETAGVIVKGQTGTQIGRLIQNLELRNLSAGPLKNSQPCRKKLAQNARLSRPLKDPAWRAKNIPSVERTAKFKELAEACEEFCKRWFVNQTGDWNKLVVFGDSRIGKSHMARAVARYCRNNATQAWWEGFRIGDVENVAFLRWSDWSNKPSREAVDDVLESSVVIVDDLGAETDQFKSGDPVRLITSILDRMEKRFVMVTTNIHQDNWADQWDNRVAFRLREASKIIDMTGEPPFVK